MFLNLYFTGIAVQCNLMKLMWAYCGPYVEAVLRGGFLYTNLISL